MKRFLLALLAICCSTASAQVRIPSGVTDQYVYFVAVDDSDYVTRETGLSGFTVYRSRNGGAAAAFTTPTVNEVDSTNMPGVYELLLDEDMTLDAGDQSQELALHITVTGMAPVTRTVEVYRPAVTAGQTITVASGIADVSVEQWDDTAVGTPNVAGIPIVDIEYVGGSDEASSLADEDSIADAIWDEAATGHTTAGTYGKYLGDVPSETGSNLTSIPWNSAWDAEVQSEAADAITAAGLSTLDAAGIRTAVGLASANMDTQFAGISGGGGGGINTPHIGDYADSVTVEYLANTLDAAGEAVTLTSEELIVVKDGATVLTGGITVDDDVSLDFGGGTAAKAGLHRVSIDTSATGYSAGNYQVIYKAGTVDGIDKSNLVIFSFSIDRYESGDSMGDIMQAKLESMQLDELFTATLSTQPVAGSLFADLTEDNSGTQRMTTGALALAPTGVDAAGVRNAVGMVAADLDAQLAALPTAAEVNTAVEGGQVGVDAATAAVAGGSPISPYRVASSRTWRIGPEGYRASNIVTVKAGFAGTFAADIAINDEADIASVSSVTFSGTNTITTSNLTKNSDGTQVHFDIAKVSNASQLDTAGDDIGVITVVTVDGQTIPLQVKLRVE